LTDLTRHEEELELGKERRRAGAAHARKHTETEHVTEVVARNIESADVERVAPTDGDSGQIETLADGSVSIPIFEERLVVTKELVVRERVIIRKQTTSEEHRVEADLRRERIEVDATGDVEIYGDDE
jgi:uncharacterized protein (TIGR02271 family)